VRERYLQKKNWTLDLLKDISIYWEKRLIIIFLMGFASGLPLLLVGQTLSVRLTEAGISLTEIGLFALVGTPYNIKFFWAPVIDRLHLPMLSNLLGRRRSWMVLVQLFLMASIVSLGFSNPQTSSVITAVLAFATAFFSASQDIVIDAYRIEILDEDQQGAGAAMSQAGYRFGMLCAGAGALYLAAAMSWSVAYGVMAGLILIGFIAALKAPVASEVNHSENNRSRKDWFQSMIADPFTEFFERSNVRVALTILVFILLYKLGDAFVGVMANPFYIKIGFSKIDIANVTKLFGVVATLLGVLTGGLIVKRFGALKSLLFCGIFQMLSNLMFAAQATIGPKVGFLFLTIGIENMSGGMGSAAFVAYLSLLCNVKYTGTQYALFTSFMAFGRTWLSAMSGWVADQTSWEVFFIVSTIIAVPGLLMLCWMLRRLPMEVQAGKGQV
jgi:MFS transporter, PAT family, beta-lactamase induction signal transducer AmpG